MNNFLNNNNLYAPGLATYGVKGNDGSIGIPGKSIYYTSFDKNIEEDLNTLKLKIQNNEVLSNNINSSLGDRTYQNGDLILDSNGIIYELSIENSNINFIELGRLNQNEFFYLSGVSYLQKERVINNFGIAVDYINTSSKNISDVSSYIYNGNINYNNVNIPYINFPHINYSDIQQNGYIPFELYTTGNTGSELSLVYDTVNNSFNYISNANLVLSASDNIYVNNNKMIYDQNNLGSVLTTNDIRSINLFNSQLNNLTDEIFNVSNSNTVLTITYNLSKLFKNSNIDINSIIINLHINNVYTNEDQLDFTNLNDIIIRNLNYSESDTSVVINNLQPNRKYVIYLSIIQNGWEINLTPKEIDTQYNVAPEIKWENNSINIGADASVFTLNATFTISANINSISDISLVEQINGITTDVQYLDASITSFNAASEDGITPGSIQVSVNIDSNENKLENTNSRTCSIFIKKNDNTLTSNGLTINQNGNTVSGVFSTTWNLTTHYDYPLTVQLPFVSKIYDENSDDPIFLDFNCVIDWGDGTEPTVCVFEPDGSDPNEEMDRNMYRHTYEKTGTYIIKIGGHIGGWSYMEYTYGHSLYSERNLLINSHLLQSVNEWTIEDGINYVEGMFYNCSNLNSLPNTPLKINFKSNNKSVKYMFYYCILTNSMNNINNIFEDSLLNSIINAEYLFSNAGINISYDNLVTFISKLTNVEYCNGMFDNAYNLYVTNNFKLSDIIPPSKNLIDISRMYAYTKKFKGGMQNGYYISNYSKLKTAAALFSNSNITGSIGTMFNNCSSLEECSELLYYCRNITEITQSLWIACQAVIDVQSLCGFCSSLTSVTSNLFDGTKCNINLPPLSTEASSTTPTNKIVIPYDNETPSTSLDPTLVTPVSQICNCYAMFNCCTNLKTCSIDLSNMPYLGRTCAIYRTNNDPYYGKESAEISGDIHNMFNLCTSLTTMPIIIQTIISGSRPLRNTYYMWEFRNYSNNYCEMFTSSFNALVFYGCGSLSNYSSIPAGWK